MLQCIILCMYYILYFYNVTKMISYNVFPRYFKTIILQYDCGKITTVLEVLSQFIINNGCQ